MFGYIYETTNLVNGKTYIGKRNGEFNPNYYGSGIVLQQALKKYGKESFSVQVLGRYDSESELNLAEIMFIESRSPTYNIARGGSGGDTLARADSETRAAVIEKRRTGLSEAHKNLTPEKRAAWNNAISDAKKGIVPNRLGYQHSDEVKRRIRESNKKAAKNRPESWKKAHALSAQRRKGIINVHSQRPVEVDGVIYDGVMIAAAKLKVTRQTINKWIKKGKARYV